MPYLLWKQKFCVKNVVRKCIITNNVHWLRQSIYLYFLFYVVFSDNIFPTTDSWTTNKRKVFLGAVKLFRCLSKDLLFVQRGFYDSLVLYDWNLLVHLCSDELDSYYTIFDRPFFFFFCLSVLLINLVIKLKQCARKLCLIWKF